MAGASVFVASRVFVFFFGVETRRTARTCTCYIDALHCHCGHGGVAGVDMATPGSLASPDHQLHPILRVTWGESGSSPPGLSKAAALASLGTFR